MERKRVGQDWLFVFNNVVHPDRRTNGIRHFLYETGDFRSTVDYRLTAAARTSA